MDAITIEAAPRAVGKTAAKAVRREGNVPCILYANHTEPVAFQVPELTLNKLIYTSELSVVRIEIDGKSYECVLKEATFHPVTDVATHADFQVLEAGELMTVTVPVQFHGTPIGQKEGGDTQYNVHELVVRCLPKDIPGHLDVDVAHMSIGDAIHVGDLEVEGLEFVDSPQRTVVTVVAPRLTVEDEEDAAVAPALDAEDEGEAEEGDEA